MKLVHFSDVHVQLPDWRTRSLRALGPLRALATVELWKGRGRDYDGAAATLAALAARAESMGAHAICTGDFTQLGHEEEFALARRALGPLASDRARFTALPGNHDRYYWRGPRLWERHFPEQTQSDLPGPIRVRLLDGVAILLLESAPVPSWPVLAYGAISPAVVPALRGLLAHPEVRSRCALVATHHAPRVRTGRADWPWHGLRGAGDFLRACAEGGAQAVLCGHVHDRFDLPAAADRPRILCAGSSTERGHEGYLELTVEGARLVSVEARALG